MTGHHSVFLVRCDGEEKQTWGNRFQSISNTDWREMGHCLCFFLPRALLKLKLLLLSQYLFIVYLFLYFTALILTHPPILTDLKTGSLHMLGHSLKPRICTLSTIFHLFNHVKTGLICLSVDP